MKKFLIKNEVLDADFFLCVGSDKELTKFLNKIDTQKWEIDNDPDVLGSFCRLRQVNKKYNICRVINLIKFNCTVVDLGVLAHEIQHYVNDVCASKGIKSTRGDEETSAYLSEYTLKECLKALGYKNIRI